MATHRNEIGGPVNASSNTAAAPIVLVLMGGPDSERAVSLQSGRAVAEALAAGGRFTVSARTIEALDAAGLAELLEETSAACVFPVLHGPWGEGGPLQDLLEHAGAAFVGSDAAAAAAAMDKAQTKAIARDLLERSDHAAHVAVDDSVVVDPALDEPPIEPPCVVKPNAEGSTVGLHIVRSADDWRRIRTELRPTGLIAEPFITGRELTAPLIDDGSGALRTLPIVEIAPADGHYDFAAKYERGDTRYTVAPDLPAGCAQHVQAFTLELARSMRLRHLARADFILDDRGVAHFLEINTMPGFTAQSLLPMAAAHEGVDLPALTARLVDRAIAERPAACGAR
jgi:D-alanine-D-alanine ligase